MPLNWGSEVPGCSKQAIPVKILLKSEVKPVTQSPMKLEARQGLSELTSNFVKLGLLVECKSEYNTFILVVKDPHGKEYRLCRI